MMLLGKSNTVIVSVAAILLAAAAAPPKLRGTIRMGILLAQNGLPLHAINTVVRLSALSTVDRSTCSESPAGMGACYLVDDSEENRAANEAAWKTMDENNEGQALIWFSLLQNGDGKADISKMAAKTLGVTIEGLTELSEDEYKMAIGAAHRSLIEEKFQQAECDAVTGYLDENDDGMLSVSERIGGMKGDCDEQASAATELLCNFYVSLFSEYVPQGDITLEEFCDFFVGIEVPMKAALKQD